jgi:hypothetical protein
MKLGSSSIQLQEIPAEGSSTEYERSPGYYLSKCSIYVKAFFYSEKYNVQQQYNSQKSTKKYKLGCILLKDYRYLI